MDELGATFDVIRDISKTAADVFDTMNTIQDICDGTCAALSAASVIPGAAAVTGPVIGTYMSIRPTLVTVIDVGGTIVQFMAIACEVLDAVDALMSGDFVTFANEAMGVAEMAMAD